jgi:hypothetical protein
VGVVERMPPVLAHTAGRRLLFAIGPGDSRRAMRECPSCGLCNPDTQVTCDCGFDLVHGQAEFERRRRVKRASATMAIGIAMIVFPIDRLQSDHERRGKTSLSAG